jgi:predicted nuclease of predicted toxin-antitoxin system
VSADLRFIVDESAGVAVVEYLRGVGHDVLSVAESMLGAEDQDILGLAVGEGRILVTNDKDFGELIFRGGQAHCGVLLIRLRDESVSNRVRVLKIVLEQYGDRLAGHFTVATDGGVRIQPAREPS